MERLLHRQIHPSFIQDGTPTSQAFRPTVKDEGKLSAYDGAQISPENSWKHYTEDLKLESNGVMSLSSQECADAGLTVDFDRTPFPEHVSIVFNGVNVEKVSKKLKSRAIARGWQFLPDQV
jgi:hypothetical protein